MFEVILPPQFWPGWALPCQEAMYQSDFLHTDPAPAVRFVTLYNQGDHHPPAKCKNKDGKSSIFLSKITSQFTRFCIYENSWLSWSIKFSSTILQSSETSVTMTLRKLKKKTVNFLMSNYIIPTSTNENGDTWLANRLQTFQPMIYS